MKPSGLKIIFVGYNDTSKSYRVYITSQWNVVVRKDVNFDEDALSSESHEPPIDVIL